MRQPRIHVFGQGLAASVFALLAARHGCSVAFERGQHPVERIVSVPASTADMLEQLTGVSIERTVPTRHAAARRIAWESRQFEYVAAESLVFDTAALGRVLAEEFDRVNQSTATDHADAPADWTIVADRRAATAPRLTAGRRRASTGWVESLPCFDAVTTLAASVPEGWLFAAPHPASGVCLTVVSPRHTQADAGARLLREAVDFLWPGAGSDVQWGNTVSAAPSLTPACAADGEMAIGEAAVFFDPLRGDGVGHAVRGALLAQAVIAAAATGQEAAHCLAYYRARITHAFVQHLESASLHYRNAWNASTWRHEIDCMLDCTRLLATSPPSGFRLEGHALVAVA
jgi:hypothetical protein